MPRTSGRSEAGARTAEPAHSAGQPEAGGDAAPWPEQLAVRVAWSYHILGLTQQQVAARLGLTRVRVNRLLAEARERGIVRVTITSALAANAELEERLIARFGLRAARVVLGPADEGDDAGAPGDEPGGDGAGSAAQGPGAAELRLAAVLGAAGAELLAARLRDGMTVGVGWGITLKALAASAQARPFRGAAVVALLGSLNRRSAIDAYEATTLLATKLAAECYYLPGPLICDEAEARETLLRQPFIGEVRARARAADLAVLSIGGIGGGTVRQVGLIGEAELAELRAAGAVGNFLGHYIDAGAALVRHPVNARVIGMEPGEILQIPERLMVSGGPDKITALGAVLRAGLVTDLVTDRATAAALLDPPD